MQNRTRSMIQASLFAVLTAVGAQVRIPLPLVPMTLQVLFVFLSGVLLPPRAALLSMVLYVAMGLLGLPVFAGESGPSVVLHPTFGFLLGFILAAWLISAIVSARGQRFPVCLAACLAGLAVIYGTGIAGLFLNVNFVMGKTMTWTQAVKVGMIPFVAGDLLKGLAAAFIASRIGPRLSAAGAGDRR
ncbi:MAG: biotin transporter BioY [Synergistaceae bacterium]|jgi:biotin transport system substrate-specific component|nr:biotin transporter BioY [Synergistaceae bacterium]